MSTRKAIPSIIVAPLLAVCLATAYGASNTPRLADVGLREFNKHRPAMSMFYYAGHPGVYAQGRASDWDVARIGAYFDAVGEDIGGLWMIGPPGDAAKSRQIVEQIAGSVGLAQKHGLGEFVHTHAGAPKWFQEGVNDYGLTKDVSGNDPMLLCGTIADPRYYSQVIDRYANEIIGGIPPDKRPNLWWLESEPGVNYVDYVRLRTIDYPNVVSLWRRFLAGEYGDIAKLNRAAGLSYASFDDVPLKENNWLVRIMVARFASWLLYTHYQGQEVAAFKQHSGGVPVATRFCEMGGAGLDPRDFSRYDSVDVDYPGFTWYAGNPFIPYSVDSRSLLGKASANFSMIKFYGKPISSGELGYWRGRREDETTDPNKDFGAMRAFRPWEVENLLYRCLYYNIGLFNFFNYTFPNDNVNWSSHAQWPDFLKAVKSIADDWDRIQPYATFGKALPNEAGIIISRNSLLFPVAGDVYKDDAYFSDPKHDGIWRAVDQQYYGDVWWGAVPIMEDPKLSYFDIMEEHAPLVAPETINQYKGLIVYDACLSDKTRKMVNDFASTDKPVLVIGASKYVDGLYLPAQIPQSYPVTAIVGNKLMECVGHFDKKANIFVYTSGELVLTLKAEHPLLASAKKLKILAPVEVTPASGATVLADCQDKPVMVAKGNVAYISGLPYDLETRIRLYGNFLAWCGARAQDLYVSRFENAIILQNYKSDHIRTWSDGEILQEFPQTASVTMDTGGGQTYEAKGDFPWLAFEDKPRGREIQGIHFDSCQIRVMRHLDGPVQPHFENCPPGLGFTQFMLGTTRLRGYFKVERPGEYKLRFVPAMWGDRKIRWQLTQDSPLSTIIMAKSEGTEISFRAPEAGKVVYRLEIISEMRQP